MLQVSILSVSVSIFNFVSVRLNCQCQIQFRFFVSGFTDIDSKLRYPYLSLSYAPWSEGGCLSSAKLRSTDSVNPRAVLSRVLPRYRPLLCVTTSLSWTSRCLVLVRPTVTRRLVLGHIYEKDRAAVSDLHQQKNKRRRLRSGFETFAP